MALQTGLDKKATWRRRLLDRRPLSSARDASNGLPAVRARSSKAATRSRARQNRDPFLKYLESGELHRAFAQKQRDTSPRQVEWRLTTSPLPQSRDKELTGSRVAAIRALAVQAIVLMVR